MGKKSRVKRERRQPAPNIIQPPPEITATIDRVSAEDRDWFEAHPGEEYRMRPAVPGEFWPSDAAWITHVVVRQVLPGFRLRFPMARIHKPEKEWIQ